MPDLIGRTVAGYPIARMLGSGVYTVVYFAQTSEENVGVAVKVLKDDLAIDRNYASAFLRGAGEAGAVSHANFAAVFGSGTDAVAGPYVLMEAVRGKSLTQIVASGMHTGWRDALEVLRQSAEALGVLAEMKLSHGDIRPTHILVTMDQDVKIASPCLSRYLPSPLPQILPVALLGYLSPEVARGAGAILESDLYSLAACVYFLMSGRAPFVGKTREEVLDGVLSSPPTPLQSVCPDAPDSLEELLVRRLLAKEPHQRYGSVQGLIGDIGRLMGDKPLEPLPMREPIEDAPSKRSGETQLLPKKPGTAKARSNSSSVVTKKATAGAGPALKALAEEESGISRDEVRGDELYKKGGQLPLALTAWKEAYRNHPGNPQLKQKIEAAELELRHEAYREASASAHRLMGQGKFEEAATEWEGARNIADNDSHVAEARRLYLICKERGASQRRLRMIILLAAVVGLVVAVAGASFLIYKQYWLKDDPQKFSARQISPVEDEAKPPQGKQSALRPDDEPGKTGAVEPVAKTVDPVVEPKTVEPKVHPPIDVHRPPDDTKTEKPPDPHVTPKPTDPPPPDPNPTETPKPDPAKPTTYSISDIGVTFQAPGDFMRTEAPRGMALRLGIPGPKGSDIPKVDMQVTQAERTFDDLVKDIPAAKDLLWNKEKRLDGPFKQIDRKWRVREMSFRFDVDKQDRRETMIYICEQSKFRDAEGAERDRCLLFQFIAPQSEFESRKATFRQIMNTVSYKLP